MAHKQPDGGKGICREFHISLWSDLCKYVICYMTFIFVPLPVTSPAGFPYFTSESCLWLYLKWYFQIQEHQRTIKSSPLLFPKG